MKVSDVYGMPENTDVQKAAKTQALTELTRNQKILYNFLKCLPLSGLSPGVQHIAKGATSESA